jgi:hypothetical protein
MAAARFLGLRLQEVRSLDAFWSNAVAAWAARFAPD